jgi:hypothetical protein
MGDRQLDNLWKEFGRESQAGKILFALYKAPNKPKVFYPAVKTKKKPLPIEESRSKSAKPQPQIEYPDPIKKKTHKFHPIDFVPHKKNKKDIEMDLETEYRHIKPPPNRGVNREEMKTQLQDKFTKGTGALPKKVMLPSVSDLEIKPVARTKPAPAKEVTTDLEELFNMIVREIQERTQFLQEMKDMNQITEEVEERIKGEIASRISELQKLREMM